MSHPRLTLHQVSRILSNSLGGVCTELLLHYCRLVLTLEGFRGVRNDFVSDFNKYVSPEVEDIRTFGSIHTRKKALRSDSHSTCPRL